MSRSNLRSLLFAACTFGCCVRAAGAVVPPFDGRREHAASTLSQAAGSFAGAMDGYVAMQTSKDAGEAVTAELQAEAKSGVMARRQELQRAIGLVSAAR